MIDRTKPGLFEWTGPPGIDLEMKPVTIEQLAREGAILGAVGCRAGRAIRRGDFVRFGSEVRDDLAPVVELLPMPVDWPAKLDGPRPLGVAMRDYVEGQPIPKGDTLMTMTRNRPVPEAPEKGPSSSRGAYRPWLVEQAVIEAMSELWPEANIRTSPRERAWVADFADRMMFGPPRPAPPPPPAPGPRPSRRLAIGWLALALLLPPAVGALAGLAVRWLLAGGR